VGEPLPILMVPGLGCSARLFAEQIPALWRFGPVTVADHTRDATMAAIAGRILDTAPPRFALAGLSMGGYIAFEIMRQAPNRVIRLALLDTSARPDTKEQSERRLTAIASVKAGHFDAVIDVLFPLLVHASRQGDAALIAINRAMAADCGPETFVRQQGAIMGRVDSRPTLGNIRCPTLILVGDTDALTPPSLAEEMANGIAGARLVVVPQCGHLSTLERPAAVNAALAAWLEG
jgi:pimeloyl-ACP methyl ester carboxylesterase